MYQALYRKYRPSTFKDVVGQDVIIQTLKNAIQNNKLTHAYLFAGPRGTGKTSTAKILAKTINCKNLNNFEPCNECDSCIQINNKQTTDIIEIDAASNNGVDEIRELKSKVNLVPSNSKYKVYIIDEVHMLSPGAFNALLKTLEEPPQYIIFILATTEPHKIPATILSRCQRFDFKKISTKKIVENLNKIVSNENIIIENEALEEIAILSQGGMRDSISLLDQAISYCPENISCQDIHDINGTIGNEEMKKIIDVILDKKIAQLLKIFDDLDDKGKNLIKLVEELVLYLRNILIYQVAPNYFEETEKKIYIQMSEKIEPEILLKYIKKFSKTIYDMKNSDNEKITLEINLIEMSNIEVAASVQIEESVEKRQENKISVENLQSKKQPEIIEKKSENIKIDIPLKTEEENIKNKQIEEIKRIRINNTLSGFNKKELLQYKEKLEQIKKHLFDEIYSQWVSLIFDGELKASGKNHLIFVYKDIPMESLFNQNWNIIEEILEDTYHEKIKVVATNIEEWNQIKQEFNSKTKKYEWKEEPVLNTSSPNENKKEKKNKIETIFQDIIEYS